MDRVGERDLERMDLARLEDDDIHELVIMASECTFLFTDADGWPAGVTMSYLYLDGIFWLTAVTSRQHVRAVERDARVGMVISNSGTALTGRRMVRMKGRATLHCDRTTLDTILPLISAKLSPQSAERFQRLLDSPNRVLIRVEPVAFPQTHDSRKVGGDGRGGPCRPGGTASAQASTAGGTSL
jgi:general stress protein 26